MAHYNAVLFDLDNTLFDYDTASATAFRQTLETEGIHGDFDAIYADYHRINMELWEKLEARELDLKTLQVLRFKLLGDRYDWQTMDWAKISARYLKHLGREAVLYPDTRMILDALTENYILGVLTNGIETVQRERMLRSGLGDRFKSFVISSAYGITKPDPRIFRIALDTMSVSAGETLYVGDSVTSDMAGAANAGIDFCWFNPGRQPAPSDGCYRYQIAQLKELLDIL